MPTFRIQDTVLEAPLSLPRDGSLIIKSSPRPYEVSFLSHLPLASTLDDMVAKSAHPVVLADKRVVDLYLKGAPALSKAPSLIVDATEDFKTIDGALEMIDLMEKSKVTRSSMMYVIGGGIIQDVGAFAGYMYKRGVPWTYVPTTLLAQGDSCVGGKTGLNFRQTKNLLALFSAPRRVLIHTGFLETLDQDDVLSGMGEIFRLCVTGGPDFVEFMEQRVPAALDRNNAALTELIQSSLAVKRAVVEYDEFELDLRRSMNLGHSIGHAFEAITNHGIPHGIGVSVGILVESEISYRRGLLSDVERQRLQRLGAQLISPKVKKVLEGIDFADILEVLRRDKKTEGSVLKLVVVETIGQIRFIDLELEPATVDLLKASLARVLEQL